MRIGIDAQLLGDKETGVEGYIRHLIRYLPLTDPKDQVVVFLRRGAAIHDFLPEHILHFSSSLTRWRSVRFLWEQGALPFLLRKYHIDVSHAPAYVAPLFASRPLVLTVHDMIAFRFPTFCKPSNRFHYRVVLPCSVSRAVRIIVPSECTKRDLIRCLRTPEEKIIVIPEGIDSQFVPIQNPERLRGIRTKYALPEHFVLFVGNQEPKKNLEGLLQAFCLLRSRGLSHHLVVVGGKRWGMGGTRWEELLGSLGKAVHQIGYAPKGDLPSIYTLADLFVFPSLYEGFGLPPLEAMACGTPVVCSTAGAFLEVVGDAAILVDPHDIRALAECMKEGLLNTEVRGEIRGRGIEQAKRFRWEEVAQRTWAVYKEVLSALPRMH